MDKTDNEKSILKENGLSNGFIKSINASVLTWPEHITVVDLSNQKLSTIHDNVKFPTNLVDLNLSHNRLTELPVVVHNLEKLRSLDLSYNTLQFFDESPKFCHTIEVLCLSHNCLNGPPYWVWTDSPARLTDLDLSFNVNLTKSLQGNYGYFEELLQHKIPVVNLKANNCSLYHDHLLLLGTFTRLKKIQLGSEALTLLNINKITDVPFQGLINCCDIQSLILTNTHLYTVKNNIDIFKYLIELNLAHNYLGEIPKELCNLHNLVTLILSDNSLLYLPDDIGKLKKLVTLCVDSNDLCMLPDSIVELSQLQHLDIYNNCLCQISEVIKYVAKIDCAQNYFDEPDDADYMEKKEKLRLNIPDRFDGRKIEYIRPESEHSPKSSDDEESYLDGISCNSNSDEKYNPPSSPENWDSDEYWEPRFGGPLSQMPSTWLNFVKKKMAEGNFCPMDAHTVSIAEKVKYEKLCNPTVLLESDGQFDDFSGDDS